LTEALRSVKHLVEQVPSPTDSRAKHLRLTDQGRSALAAAIKAIEDAGKSVATGIEKSELAAAIEVMKRANQILARSLSQSW
jgi:DNA-binding MarR family transcriptional regulator